MPLSSRSKRNQKTTWLSRREDGMQEAMTQAEKAVFNQEVPVGAVLMHEGHIVSRAHNRMKADKNATAHAEWLVIQEGLRLFQSPYLVSCTLYVTLEPCAFCASAITLVRLPEVFFGAYRPHGGAVVHGERLWDHVAYPQRWIGGLEERQCRSLLHAFFEEKRHTGKKIPFF